jgi:cob(I)alamin adenosyltransferase
MSLGKGYVHIYTGHGKGKTTAALGLGLRAAGHGLRVCMVQFLKSAASGELESVRRIGPHFTIHRFEKPRDFFWKLTDGQKAEVKLEVGRAFAFARQTGLGGGCDILILDEVLGALGNGLLELERLLELVRMKPDGLEIVMTGRDAPPELIDAADLVTEMNEIKHYYRQGVPSRDGIEK